jgi:hypothetical protein
LFREASSEKQKNQTLVGLAKHFFMGDMNIFPEPYDNHRFQAVFIIPIYCIY